MFDDAVCLVMMVKLCHYRCMPVLALYQIDHPRFRLDCLDGCIWYYLEKYVSWQRCVTSYNLHQFISFGVFGSLDKFYGETLEIVLHLSDEGHISFEGGFPGNALFLDLPSNHF
jgi:hypothetical protein